MNNYFIQIEPLSDDELRKLYMKKKKAELIEMLIQSNKLLDMYKPKPVFYDEPVVFTSSASTESFYATNNPNKNN